MICKALITALLLVTAGAATAQVDLEIPVKHYPVRGLTHEAALQSLKANGMTGFHGRATWNVAYEYTTKPVPGGCRISAVRVKVSGELLMPRWLDEQAAPPDLRRRWNTYYTALKQHEDGHIQHGRELGVALNERLQALGTAPCARFEPLTSGEFKRLLATYKTKDAEYDARTQHGATQGARF